MYLLLVFKKRPPVKGWLLNTNCAGITDQAAPPARIVKMLSSIRLFGP